MKVFAVYDSRVSAFMQPSFLRSSGEAERMFVDIVNDGQSIISKHPADYTLFELGEYDDQNGKLMPHAAPVSVINALQLKSAPEPLPMFPNGAKAGASKTQ